MLTEIVIGRSNDANVTITDHGDDISRLHLAAIPIKDNWIYLKDLNTTNGTFYRGERMIPNKFYRLRRSDTIRLGKNYQVLIDHLIPWVSAEELVHNEQHFRAEKIYQVGRSKNCDIIIIDDNSEVSRTHLALYELSPDRYIICDLDSNNGTFINGQRIPANVLIELNPTDEVKLGKGFQFVLSQYFAHLSPNNEGPGSKKGGRVTFIFGTDKKLTINPSRITLGQLSDLTDEGFKTVGREANNHIIINHPDVSRLHCKLRQLSPFIFEVVDLDSTNGTFLEGERIPSNESTKFQSISEVRLGPEKILQLEKYFPNIQFLPEGSAKVRPHTVYGEPTPANPEFEREFAELEAVWEKYKTYRREFMKGSGKSIKIAGNPSELLGRILETWFGLVPGVGLAISVGGFVLERFLASRKAKKLSDDLCFEDIFLDIYCCPNCSHSFGFIPWKSIRYCVQCKTRYR